MRPQKRLSEHWWVDNRFELFLSQFDTTERLKKRLKHQSHSHFSKTRASCLLVARCRPKSPSPVFPTASQMKRGSWICSRVKTLYSDHPAVVWNLSCWLIAAFLHFQLENGIKDKCVNLNKFTSKFWSQNLNASSLIVASFEFELIVSIWYSQTSGISRFLRTSTPCNQCAYVTSFVRKLSLSFVCCDSTAQSSRPIDSLLKPCRSSFSLIIFESQGLFVSF